MSETVKTGLVLEGGAMRGLFTAGVIDVMMEHDLEFDGLIGVSAGSNFGCNYKSCQPGRVLRYNLRYASDPRYMGLRSLLTTGNLVGAEFAYHTLPLELDIFDTKRFEENPMEFYLVTTDVATGRPVYYRMDRVNRDSLEWLRASASMPAVTRPDARRRHFRFNPSCLFPLYRLQTQRGGADTAPRLFQEARSRMALAIAAAPAQSHSRRYGAAS